MAEKSQMEKILDPNDNSPIYIYDENNVPLACEHFANISYLDKYYIILKPMETRGDLEEGMVLVFELKDDDDETMELVSDDAIVSEVINKWFEASEALDK